ncbi:MAG: sugar transferase, partial [Myxococcota bacterium]
PRPHPVAEAKVYPRFALGRLAVKPGITGLAQVNGRSDLSFEQTVAWDKEYAKQRSVSLYFRILWRTVRVVISGKGAY